MPKTYRHEFQVQGTAPFPFDMLRYDACYPAHESPDSAAMGRLEHSRITVTTVTMVHTGEKHWVPTGARWRSFMWKVVPTTHKVIPIE